MKYQKGLVHLGPGNQRGTMWHAKESMYEIDRSCSQGSRVRKEQG